jgi:hypothetical protein
MLYHLFPAPLQARPYVRGLTAAERDAARDDGVELFALPDGVRRLQAEDGAGMEGITLLAGPIGDR